MGLGLGSGLGSELGLGLGQGFQPRSVCACRRHSPSAAREHGVDPLLLLPRLSRRDDLVRVRVRAMGLGLGSESGLGSWV